MSFTLCDKFCANETLRKNLERLRGEGGGRVRLCWGERRDCGGVETPWRHGLPSDYVTFTNDGQVEETKGSRSGLRQSRNVGSLYCVSTMSYLWFTSFWLFVKSVVFSFAPNFLRFRRIRTKPRSWFQLSPVSNSRPAPLFPITTILWLKDS